LDDIASVVDTTDDDDIDFLQEEQDIDYSKLSNKKRVRLTSASIKDEGEFKKPAAPPPSRLTTSSSSASFAMNGGGAKSLESRFSVLDSISSGGKSGGSSVAATTVAGIAGAAASTSSSSVSASNPPVASLSNLGNTCFLNSVLYTLRFTPGFLHSLHHLVYDLGLQGGSGGSNGGSKKRISALNGGNNSTSHHSGGSGGGGGGIADADTELVHDVVDQLHDLFKNMSCSDETPETSREAIPPNSFLQAVGKLNPMFEGNQQQDAHELLVTVLNTLQDIKIPVPPQQQQQSSNLANGSLDAVDGPAAAAGCGMMSSSAAAGGVMTAKDEKKSNKKRGGKSIFYSNSSSSSQHQTSGGGNLFYVSNGLRSSTSKLDQINNGVNAAGGGAVKASSSSVTLQNNLNSAAADPSCSPSNNNNNLLPNFVKDNFVGKSVMRTRCLECEASTYRSETFTNIDIPLTFEDQPEEPDPLSVKDLFLKQIMASETLRENNKYWCSECSRLNEAQRSVQYEILPRVMVLQLKRFTATGNKSYTSKINEYIPTPFTMHCFCTQCMPETTTTTGSAAATNATCNGGGGGGKHHYRLYAMIMHLGATLASGHYTAYVRAGELAPEYLQCNRSGNSVERKNGGGKASGKGIMKYFSRSSDQKSFGGSQGNGLNGGGGGSGSALAADANGCKSANCCGVRTFSQINSLVGGAGSDGASSAAASTPAAASAQVLHHHPHHASSLQTSPLASVHHVHQRSMDSQDSGTYHDYSNGSSSQTASEADETWLECDDETIHVISRRQFEEDLSCNRGFTTPYLLFYQRV